MTRLCPECASGKHQNCVLDAWDTEHDTITPCECDCPLAKANMESTEYPAAAVRRERSGVSFGKAVATQEELGGDVVDVSSRLADLINKARYQAAAEANKANAHLAGVTGSISFTVTVDAQCSWTGQEVSQ